MAIQFFRISELPKIVDCLKGVAPAVLNLAYPLAEENTVSFDNQSGYKGEFLDSFKIQVSEDGTIWSNPVICPIKELVGVNTPESVNGNIPDAERNGTNDLYALGKIPINNSTDRIQIVSISGYGEFLKGTMPLNINDVVYMHELEQLKAVTDNGAGIPHMSLVYRCGNHIGYNTSETFLITVDVPSFAKIGFVSRNGVDPIYENLLIDEGFSDKQVLINVTVTGNMFTQSPGSTIRIIYSGQVLSFNANGNQDITALLDNEGKSNIEIEHNYLNFGTAATSNVQVTVLEVDGNAANVSTTDSYTTTVNYS